MKTDDIFRKLHKKFVIKSTRLRIDSEILGKEFDSVIKHRGIIQKVIEEYNFKGRNFKVEYLPAILAMVIEEVEKDKKSNEYKKDNVLNDILSRVPKFCESVDNIYKSMNISKSI